MKASSLFNKIRFNLQRVHFVFKGKFKQSDFFEQKENNESIIHLEKNKNNNNNINLDSLSFSQSEFQTFPVINERDMTNKIQEISMYLKELEKDSSLSKKIPKILLNLSKIQEKETRNEFFFQLNPFIDTNLSLFNVNELCLMFYSISKSCENISDSLTNIFKAIVAKKDFFKTEDYYLFFQGTMNLKKNKNFFFEVRETIKTNFLDSILSIGKENNAFLVDFLLYINYFELEDLLIVEKAFNILGEKLKFLNKAEFLKLIWVLSKLQAAFKENNFAKKKKVIIFYFCLLIFSFNSFSKRKI